MLCLQPQAEPPARQCVLHAGTSQPFCPLCSLPACKCVTQSNICFSCWRFWHLKSLPQQQFYWPWQDFSCPACCQWSDIGKQLIKLANQSAFSQVQHPVTFGFFLCLSSEVFSLFITGTEICNLSRVKDLVTPSTTPSDTWLHLRTWESQAWHAAWQLSHPRTGELNMVLCIYSSALCQGLLMSGHWSSTSVTPTSVILCIWDISLSEES